MKNFSVADFMGVVISRAFVLIWVSNTAVITKMTVQRTAAACFTNRIAHVQVESFVMWFSIAQSSSCQLLKQQQLKLKLKLLSVRTCMAPWHFTRTYVFRVSIFGPEHVRTCQAFQYFDDRDSRHSQLTHSVLCYLTESIVHGTILTSGLSWLQELLS